MRPGPGTGGATFEDLDDCTICSPTLPASNDTYAGFAASGYGHVFVFDYGGTVDKLVVPFASTDAYFETVNGDDDPAADDLRIMTSATEAIYIRGQLEPAGSQKGHIEQIQFTDETIAIGGEARAVSLNAASTLSIGEKDERSKAAEEPVGESRQRYTSKPGRRPILRSNP